jgi:hypothetical protein
MAKKADVSVSFVLARVAVAVILKDTSNDVTLTYPDSVKTAP